MSDDLFPDVSPRLPWPLLIGLVVLLSLLVFFFLQINSSWSAVEAAPPPAPVTARTPPVPELVPHVPRTAQVVPPAPPPTPLGRDEAEVCGLGRVRVDGRGQPADANALRQPAFAVRERMLASLRDSGDETERAAGLFLQGWMPARAWRALGDNAAGGGSAPAEALAPDLASIDALARLASTTASPQVYALALAACDRRSADTGGACGLLSSEQWARLDPGNAAPWLRAAEQARQRGDAAGLSDAMYRVSQSTLHDPRTMGWVTLTSGRIPGDAPAYARTMLMGELMTVATAVPTPYSTVTRYCDAASVTDINRQLACAQVAELFAQKGQSVADLAMARSLGERTGWPAARVKAMNDEQGTLLSRAASLTPAASGLGNCQLHQRTRDHYVAVAARGELAVLRQLVQSSQISPGRSP